MEALHKALADYAELGMYSFHTPGHKGREDILGSLLIPANDLTELPELDMLHNPQGVIAQAQRKASRIYCSDETYFLVNGATVGNQAMFMALMADSTLKGKKIRIERRAHRSVVGALILSGLTPDYVSGVIHPDFNLALGLMPDHYMANNREVGAYHLTSPSYYGTVVDLDTVLELRDRESPGIPVLVDQAHGAHFLNSLFPRNAVQQGADLVVHSTHKTMAALTQAAMLHVCGQRVSRSAVQKALELLQTSSPSYLLMASLEIAMNYIDKSHSWEDLQEEVACLHRKLDPGPLRILNDEDIGYYGIKEIDWSKLLVNISPLGISAQEAVDFLRSSFRIEPELWDDNNILFVFGIGNKPAEVRLLGQALESLINSYLPEKIRSSSRGKVEKAKSKAGELFKTMVLPPVRLSPREAWLAPKKVVPLKECLGRFAGETVSIYPPGIPLIAAGEEITEDIVDYLLRAENYHWQGWQGFKHGVIQVIDR